MLASLKFQTGRQHMAVTVSEIGAIKDKPGALH